MAVIQSPQVQDRWFQAAAEAQMFGEQLKAVELFNGRAARLGFVIGLGSLLSLG
jgi:hypothetical protein